MCVKFSNSKSEIKLVALVLAVYVKSGCNWNQVIFLPWSDVVLSIANEPCVWMLTIAIISTAIDTNTFSLRCCVQLKFGTRSSGPDDHAVDLIAGRHLVSILVTKAFRSLSKVLCYKKKITGKIDYGVTGISFSFKKHFLRFAVTCQPSIPQPLLLPNGWTWGGRRVKFCLSGNYFCFRFSSLFCLKCDPSSVLKVKMFFVLFCLVCCPAAPKVKEDDGSRESPIQRQSTWPGDRCPWSRKCTNPTAARYFSPRGEGRRAVCTVCLFIISLRVCFAWVLVAYLRVYVAMIPIRNGSKRLFKQNSTET